MTSAKPSLPVDTHTHSPLCKHAAGTAREYAESAARMGLEGLACTDHCPLPDGYDPKHRMALADFPAYRRWIDEARAAVDLPVLAGMEADYYPGCENHLRSWLAEQEFDLVLGSIHYLDYWAFANPAEQGLWGSSDMKAVWRKYFALLGQLVLSGMYDVIAHFDLPKKSGWRPPEADLKEMALPVLDLVARSGMAIEINTSGLHHTICEVYPSPLILAWAHERGIPIVFGSDAHRPEHVGSDFEAALAIARAAGYCETAVFRRRERDSMPLPPQ